MNIESKYAPLVAITLSASLLSGCTSDREFMPPETTSQKSDLLFETAPRGGFSISDCETQRNGWTVHIDANPNDIDTFDQTIGFRKGLTEEGHPIDVNGVKIRSLGNLAYEIATSDNKAGETTIVDLGEAPFSQVINGGDGYDIALSARLGGDGAAYFSANCLPEFDFPYDENTLSEELPIVPIIPIMPTLPIVIES